MPQRIKLIPGCIALVVLGPLAKAATSLCIEQQLGITLKFPKAIFLPAQYFLWLLITDEWKIQRRFC